MPNRAKSFPRIARWLLVVVCLTSTAWGQAPPPMQVGTKPSPPFSMKQADGNWTGLSIELWRRVAETLELEYEFVERDLDGLISGLQNGRLDASVAALTVTGGREAVIDFSHPYYSSGLGIAVAPDGQGGLKDVLRGFPYRPFLKALSGLVVVLLATGAVVWLFERRRNREQFGGGWKGLGDGFWWSAVTMTTVGYGDKAPRTAGGRAVAVVWMFASVFMISAFTATIASLLTAERLGGKVQGVRDLPRARVGAVAASTAGIYLKRNRVGFLPFDSAEDALNALTEGQVEAVVYDAPILLHLIHESHSGQIAILPARFEPQTYAIALPAGSPLRERINLALLDVTSAEEWPSVVTRFLGE